MPAACESVRNREPRAGACRNVCSGSPAAVRHRWDILGAAGLKRFTVTSQSFGIDRVENQKIVHHERMNDGTFTLFDGNGDAAFLEAVSKLCSPFMQGLRLLLQLKRFGASLPGYSQMDSVLPIAPIQADIQCGAYPLARSASLARRIGTAPPRVQWLLERHTGIQTE